MTTAWRPGAAACVVAALALASCSWSDDDPATTATTGDVAAPPSRADEPDVTSRPGGAPPPSSDPVEYVGPVAAPVRSSLSGRSIYFVMPDRFDNGDPSNDTAGIAGGPLDHGFLPEDRGFHHGGDLAGLTARLPYLAELGMGAIWITPTFTNRFVQGDGTIEGSSSSYHGYWQIDWDSIDPHLGTEEEMQAFIRAAHDLDIAVIFDIVINHTGDVISYAEGSSSYVGSQTAPFLDAEGEPFDPAAIAGSDSFPELDPTISFPYTPTFADPADAEAKSPAWLNDVTLYHNRGNSTFNGESDTWGDFFGLDDLFTEHPRVVDGMIDLYTDVIERYDVDGFRVDTMKHVNDEFWAEFASAIRERAAELGKPEFLVFGEVFTQDPIQQSSYTNLGVTSTLDFIVDEGLHGYVAGGGDGALLAQAFDDDDWFTDHDSNATMQVTFFGNHDEGRMGYVVEVANPGADEQALLARLRLANDLLFLTRGAPVVYYGDEQGFTGTGGDQLARQDMFPSVTPDYVVDQNIGSDATPADDNFDPGHPLYRHISELNDLRTDHPTLATGAQIVHPVDGPVFAFSRIDRDERVEYVVVTNSSDDALAPARFQVVSPDTEFTVVRGPDAGPTTSGADGELFVQAPPLSTIVLRATSVNEPPVRPPAIEIVRPEDGAELPTPRYRIEAELGDRRYAEVTFAVAVDDAEPVVVGVDDAAPYRVYWNNSELPTGTAVDVIATVDDGSGRLRSDVVAITLGDRP